MNRTHKVRIRGLKAIYTPESAKPKRGRALSKLKTIKGGEIIFDKRSGLLEYVGKAQRAKGDFEVIDGAGRFAIPGFVDAHTHLVFAGSRADEFFMRTQGVPYLEIAKKGGGIERSVRSLRAASEGTLFQESKRRLETVLRNGTTTVEIKSGYGLNLNDELKTLRVIERLGKGGCPRIYSTFLGAHKIPKEYARKRDSYIKLLCDVVMPTVKEKGLAEFVDVFVEETALSAREGWSVLECAKKLGFPLRVHADEFTDSGGTALAIETGALSADHLGAISKQNIKALAESDTVAVLLPGTIFFLGSEAYAPARRLIEEGAIVALATDLNPGSSMIFSIPFVMTLGALKLRMSPPELLNAVTVNAAYSLDREVNFGALLPGLSADILLVRGDSYEEIPYRIGDDLDFTVICRGKIVRKGNV